MEIQNNFIEIYQFTLVIVFSVALVFFVYMYWYSNAYRDAAIEKQNTKQQLLENKIILVETELEKEQLEREKYLQKEQAKRLEQEVLLKNKELINSALLINQHNDVIKKITNKLDEMYADPKKKKMSIKEIKAIIRSNVSQENDWEEFKLQFEKVHIDFFTKLNHLHPSISRTDIRHCAYMKMELSTKEIARLMGISPTSVQTSRVRLKRKMELTKENDLRQYIQNL